MIDAGAWALVHFLWQGTLVWLTVAVLLPFLGEARTRYAVACAAMLLMSVLPLATFIVLTHDAEAVTRVDDFFVPSASLVKAATVGTASQTPWMPVVVSLWASGVAFFSLRNAGGLALVYIRRRAALLDVPIDYRGFNIPNKFVFGFGLDLDEYYRNLPFVGVVDLNKYKPPA